MWDWAANASNYATLQQQAEAAANYATWQIESSLQTNTYFVEQPILGDDVSQDYPVATAPDGGAAPASDGGAVETSEQARTDDLAAAFPDGPGAVWITRLRADLSQQALATDLTIGASADQTPLSNIYRVQQSVNPPACPPVPNPCPPCGGSAGGSSGSSSGSTGMSSGGTTTKPAGPGQQSFGCSAAPADRGNLSLDLVLGGMFGVSLVRSRLRRRAKNAKK